MRMKPWRLLTAIIISLGAKQDARSEDRIAAPLSDALHAVLYPQPTFSLFERLDVSTLLDKLIRFAARKGVTLPLPVLKTRLCEKIEQRRSHAQKKSHEQEKQDQRKFDQKMATFFTEGERAQLEAFLRTPVGQKLVLFQEAYTRTLLQNQLERQALAYYHFFASLGREIFSLAPIKK